MKLTEALKTLKNAGYICENGGITGYEEEESATREETLEFIANYIVGNFLKKECGITDWNYDPANDSYKFFEGQYYKTTGKLNTKFYTTVHGKKVVFLIDDLYVTGGVVDDEPALDKTELIELLSNI